MYKHGKEDFKISKVDNDIILKFKRIKKSQKLLSKETKYQNLPYARGEFQDQNLNIENNQLLYLS